MSTVESCFERHVHSKQAKEEEYNYSFDFKETRYDTYDSDSSRSYSLDQGVYFLSEDSDLDVGNVHSSVYVEATSSFENAYEVMMYESVKIRTATHTVHVL